MTDWDKDDFLIRDDDDWRTGVLATVHGSSKLGLYNELSELSHEENPVYFVSTDGNESFNGYFPAEELREYAEDVTQAFHNAYDEFFGTETDAPEIDLINSEDDWKRGIDWFTKDTPDSYERSHLNMDEHPDY